MIKIGATRNPVQRFSAFGKFGSLYCWSPVHFNFFENEEILHEAFKQFRVPPRPNASGDGPEIFNVGMKYFFQHLPQLDYVGVEQKGERKFFCQEYDEWARNKRQQEKR